MEESDKEVNADGYTTSTIERTNEKNEIEKKTKKNHIFAGLCFTISVRGHRFQIIDHLCKGMQFRSLSQSLSLLHTHFHCSEPFRYVTGFVYEGFYALEVAVIVTV